MKKKLIVLSLFIFIDFTSLTANANDEYTIIVKKNDKELIVKKSDTIVKKYHIATGKGGTGTKGERGDSKTPLGVYRISKLNKS